MDGNGRWAKERGKERVFGHAEGIESVRAITEACAEWGIPYLSLFAFSEENWGRPEEEVNALMELLVKYLRQELSNMMTNNIRFFVLGNRARLSDALKADIDKVMSATAANKGVTMILFLSYSGRWDILQAAEKMAHDLINQPGHPVQPEDFSRYLVTADIPDPDLLIRTSGEQRLSNYLMWQLAYAELYFTQTPWPAFSKKDLELAIEAYNQRTRRFGGLKKGEEDREEH